MPMPMAGTRAFLVDALRARLVAEGFPRVTMMIIVVVAGGSAFLSSALALWAGLHSMPLGYGLAAAIGYAVAVVGCVTAAGYALQLAAPDARSIGGVMRALMD